MTLLSLLSFSIISYIVSWVILTGMIYVELKEDGQFTLYDLLFVCKDKYSIEMDSMVNTLSIGRYIPYWNLCVLLFMLVNVVVNCITEFFIYISEKFRKRIEPKLSKITFNKSKK